MKFELESLASEQGLIQVEVLLKTEVTNHLFQAVHHCYFQMKICNLDLNIVMIFPLLEIKEV
jgi:hypothetical protein